LVSRRPIHVIGVSDFKIISGPAAYRLGVAKDNILPLFNSHQWHSSTMVGSDADHDSWIDNTMGAI
jgi:hypothetical protein